MTALFRKKRKQVLLHNIHWKLTFLFTTIAGLVLIIMSISYLYMSEKELQKNSYLSFLSESGTIISNIEQQNIITHNWLSKIASNEKYVLALYDNGIPLTHTTTNLSPQQQDLAEEVLAVALEHDSFQEPSSKEHTMAHTQFTYAAENGTAYYVSVARLGNTSAPLYAVILFSTQALNRMLVSQRFRFLGINLIGILLLFLVSYVYTAKLLAPIGASQKKQNAFIAAASHELRTPLAVILSCIDASKHADTAVKEQFLQTMEQEGRRMSTLINDMLTLAGADNHTWTLTMAETELDTLLLNSFEAFSPIAKEKHMTLKIEVPEENLPTCHCDAERISQVLSILLSNAFSYGTENGYVKLSLSFASPCFYLQVEDNGIGISDQAKPFIFDRFYREETSRSQKNHFGLGLCIAKEIMDAHHGSIEVTDTPGGGTTFTVKLPEIVTLYPYSL